MLPETANYQERQRLRRCDAAKTTSGSPSLGAVFINQGRLALGRHWILLTYLVLLMAGFNFMSHGSQDLYPTMLESQLGFDKTQVTVTQVVANLGAMLGGSTVGFVSQSIGRRLSIILCCILGAALLYPYGFVRTEAVMAAAFFEQFCVQGAWGVIPIHLMELSPGALRTFVVGTSYQLGNLISSASSTIEAHLGERYPLSPSPAGEARYDYGRVICIFMACVYAYVVVLTLVGPEHLSRNLDPALEEDDALARAHHHDPEAATTEQAPRCSVGINPRHRVLKPAGAEEDEDEDEDENGGGVGDVKQL